jgi:hypothetical protein
MDAARLFDVKVIGFQAAAYTMCTKHLEADVDV